MTNYQNSLRSSNNSTNLSYIVPRKNTELTIEEDSPEIMIIRRFEIDSSTYEVRTTERHLKEYGGRSLDWNRLLEIGRYQLYEVGSDGAAGNQIQETDKPGIIRNEISWHPA